MCRLFWLMKFMLTPYWIGGILKAIGVYMIRTFIQTTEFSRNWDKLGFSDDDLRLLELDIMKFVMLILFWLRQFI